MSFCIYAIVLSGITVLLLGMVFLTPLAKMIGAVHLFRSIGFIKESTIRLAFGNFINIIFDFVWIVLLKWGTAGAVAWNHQYDNQLFSGIGKSGQIPAYYRHEKCRVVHP